MKFKPFSLISTIIVLSFAASAASATVINFDNIAGGTTIDNGTAITNQYAGLGVTFDDGSTGNQALVTLASAPNDTGASPPNVLFVQQHEFLSTPAPLRINFSVVTNQVSLLAFQSLSAQFTMAAYGANNSLLESITGPSTAQYGVAQLYSLTEASPISYLLLSSSPGGSNPFNFSIDDLTFVDTLPGGVPEPASWGLMIAGFGMAGAAMRRRHAASAA